MKPFRIISPLLLLLLFFGTSLAQEIYVQDNIPITLRAGQGTQYRIIAMITSENALTFVEEGNGWTRVRTVEGQEGWVLTRYLTDRKPARQALADLEQEYTAMQASLAEPAAEIARLKDENRSLQEELSGVENNLQKLAAEYETLQTESADYIQVRNRLNDVSQQFDAQRQFAETCETALGELQRKQHIYWFISGAGVLLLGFVIGFSMRRKNKRSSLLG